MEEIPDKLKVTLAGEVHRDIKEQIKFFSKNMESSFLSWVGHRLIPRIMEDEVFLYQDFDPIDGIYFLKAGTVAFIAPRLNNKVFFEVNCGEIVGLEDIVYEEEIGVDKELN